MKGMELAMASVLAGAGCAVLAAALRRAARRRRATEGQLAALAATVKTLQARVAELSRAASSGPVESIAAAAEGAGVTRLHEPRPETLAVLTAAATAFLGKAAHLRSARLSAGSAESVSPWSQQGRVIVQTSHNLRSRE